MALVTTTAAKKMPAMVGRYDLLEKVGTGGMGSVYRGRDRETGEAVAVKVLGAKLAENPKLHHRLVQEFRSASKLDHPNIVRVLDLALDGSTAYLVMEFVEGESLGAMIARLGKLPEGQAVRIVTQAAQALHYAHRRRIIHRDVKPDNILVRADGMVKLADFGLAKDKNNDRDLTRPATGLGTPHFMAPEQYEDAKNAGVLCDVYSLGATLYNAVTGKLPFDNCVSLATLAKKIKGDVPPPRQLVPDLSEQVDEAIRRAMSPNPAKRPASCLQFANLLPAQAQWGRLGEFAPRRPACPARYERRTAPRHPCTLGITCVIDTDLFAGGEGTEETWPGTVHDIGPRGLGLVMPRRFERGTAIRVEVEGGGEQPARRLAARVAHVRPEALGHWFHGCVFADPLSDQALREWLRAAR
jgi:serine/threonine protein kinase